MGLFFEIKTSFKLILNDKITYGFLFFQLVVFSSLVKYFQTDIFLVTNLFFSIAFSYSRSNNININHVFRIIVISFLLFLIPILFYGLSYLYAGFFIRILTGYFIAYAFRDKFVEYYHNILFFLAVISIVFFVIQIIDINLFSVFDSFTELVINDDRKVQGEEGYSHKYLLVYLVNGWAINRNSGFMWEPAGFGAVLTWAIIFNLFLYRFKLNVKMIVFVVALFTTFSVGAYTYLGLLLIIYITQKGLSVKHYLAIILIGSGFVFLFTQTTLFGDQFNMMQNKIEDEPLQIEQVLKDPSLYARVSRVVGFYTNWYYFAEFPFGYGFMESTGRYSLLASTPNGLMVILVRWGIFGISLIIYLFLYGINFLKRNYYQELKVFPFLLLIVTMILPFSGNPFDNQPFLFSLLLFPFTIDRRIVAVNRRDISV